MNPQLAIYEQDSSVRVVIDFCKPRRKYFSQGLGHLWSQAGQNFRKEAEFPGKCGRKILGNFRPFPPGRGFAMTFTPRSTVHSPQLLAIRHVALTRAVGNQFSTIAKPLFLPTFCNTWFGPSSPCPLGRTASPWTGTSNFNHHTLINTSQAND